VGKGSRRDTTTGAASDGAAILPHANDAAARPFPRRGTAIVPFRWHEAPARTWNEEKARAFGAAGARVGASVRRGRCPRTGRFHSRRSLETRSVERSFGL